MFKDEVIKLTGGVRMEDPYKQQFLLETTVEKGNGVVPFSIIEMLA
jgi:hypothetical protein